MSNVSRHMHGQPSFHLVELVRRMDEPPWQGFLVAQSSELLVLHRVSDRYDLDGYCAFRAEDVVSVDAEFPRHELIERALRLKREEARLPTGMDASSMRELMESAQRVFGVLLIDREFVQPGEVEVGTIRMTSADTYVLRWLDPNAHWENDSRPFRYRDVTRLEFGGEYEQTLLAVARSRESDG